MDISIINSLEEFEDLRPDWERLWLADQHATVFISWSWLRGWFDVTSFAWSILGVKDRGQWLGFLPISLRGATHSYRLDQVRELCMAGDPGADYTGFVCDPAHERQAVAALAEFILHELSWDRLRWRDLRDPRIGWFAESLPIRLAKVQQAQGSCCPHLPLPPTWDEYTRCLLSSETRRSLGKRLRAVERECRLAWRVGGDVIDDLDAMMGLVRLRRPEAEEALQRARRLFESCAADGSACIATIWCGREPVASQGMFIDQKHRALRVYLSGFDDRFARWSPGRVLDAMCIRQAIEQNLADYDFLRGDEPYKFQFGAVARHNRTLTAVRRNVHSATRIAVSRMRDSLRI